MIFPYLAGFLSPLKAPVTYFLLFINLLVFGVTAVDFDSSSAAIDSFLDDDFLNVQGSAFAAMIAREPQKFSVTLKTLADETRGSNDVNALQALGGFALRNTDFMSRAQTFDFGGDEIAISRWRQKLVQFQKIQDENPSYRYGLSEMHQEWRNYFSYQFSHAGFAHLFWNMVFLVLFGCFVEKMLGGTFVIITYVAGGFLGAVVYSLLSGISYSPLVGASGAVSALIGLVTVAWWRREKLPFLYMLIPTPEYIGFALLPSWLLGLVFILPDVSHYLSSSREVGSVAYAAHIGGALFGSVIAGGVLAGWLPSKKTEPVAAPVLPKPFRQAS